MTSLGSPNKRPMITKNHKIPPAINKINCFAEKDDWYPQLKLLSWNFAKLEASTTGTNTKKNIMEIKPYGSGNIDAILLKITTNRINNGS